MPRLPKAALFLWMPRAKTARGKVLGALPRTPARGLTPPETPAPFPFCSTFRNGPRRQGFAAPRKHRAPLTAPGRSENLPYTRERTLVKTAPLSRLPLVGPEPTQPLPPLTPQPRRILSRVVLSFSPFQDHLVLETVFGFSIILQLENAVFENAILCLRSPER